MSKRGSVLYLFLLIAIIALVGMIYAIIHGNPTGKWGEGLDCQSQCFGTQPGMPMRGQESLGGAALRQCLANCQAGISPHQQAVQECYTCSGGGQLQKLTASDQTEAHIMCERVGGSEAIITSVSVGACPY